MSIELLTTKEAAQLLRISTKTLDKWRLSGKIHGLKLGHTTVRFSRADLDTFLASAGQTK